MNSHNEESRVSHNDNVTSETLKKPQVSPEADNSEATTNAIAVKINVESSGEINVVKPTEYIDEEQQFYDFLQNAVFMDDGTIISGEEYHELLKSGNPPEIVGHVMGGNHCCSCCH